MLSKANVDRANQMGKDAKSLLAKKAGKDFLASGSKQVAKATSSKKKTKKLLGKASRSAPRRRNYNPPKFKKQQNKTKRHMSDRPSVATIIKKNVRQTETLKGPMHYSDAIQNAVRGQGTAQPVGRQSVGMASGRGLGGMRGSRSRQTANTAKILRGSLEQNQPGLRDRAKKKLRGSAPGVV